MAPFSVESERAGERWGRQGGECHSSLQIQSLPTWLHLQTSWDLTLYPFVTLEVTVHRLLCISQDILIREHKNHTLLMLCFHRFKNVIFEIAPTEEVGDFEVKAKFMGVQMETFMLHYQVGVHQVGLEALRLGWSCSRPGRRHGRPEAHGEKAVGAWW